MFILYYKCNNKIRNTFWKEVFFPDWVGMVRSIAKMTYKIRNEHIWFSPNIETIRMLLITWEWVKTTDEDRAVSIAAGFLFIVLFCTTEGVYRVDS